MTTPVTEISYPPYDSQALHTFITDQGGTVTGDLQTDFRNALFISVAPGGKANDYSIDDLWARHIQVNVSGDANAAPGNPAAAGRGKLGFVGMSLVAYYIQTYLRNPGNANAFPGGGSNPDTQTMSMDFRNGSVLPTISNGGQTITTSANNYAWMHHSTDVYDKDYTEGGKFIIEVTVDSFTSGFCCGGGGYDPDQNVSSSYGGNHDGFGYLGSGSLSRIYHGPDDLNYTGGSPNIAVATGVVITTAINLDDDEITVYIDGATTGTNALARTTPTSNMLRPVIKQYGTCQQTINPTILHPQTGYVAWA